MSNELQTAGGAAVSGSVDTGGGDFVGRDAITVGDVSASYVAMGAGAQVIVRHIEQALSAIEEMEKARHFAESVLALAIQEKVVRYTSLPERVPAGEQDNPYKALSDYRLEDAPFFYGRAEAIAAMRERLHSQRLTILYSDSGSGKSSLLQAGLASRLLAQGDFPLYLRPYRQRPDRALRRSILPDYETQPELARFREERMSLHGFLQRVTHYLGRRNLYVFVDQFEEFFGELPVDEQHSFAAELQACCESDLPVWWVLALRKESFADLRLFAPLRPFDNAYFLPTFRVEEAREVVTEPAARKGVSYEEGLVQTILDDLHQEEAGVLPAHVQLVCHTLYAEKGAGARQITHALYQQPRGRGAAGAGGILTGHLGRVLQRDMDAAGRELARHVLEALVTARQTRAIKSQQELLAEIRPDRPAALIAVLDRLVDSRLLRTSRDTDDDLLYELTHDLLLAEIELDPERQRRKVAREMLAYDAWVWQESGPQQEMLIPEERLLFIEASLEPDTLAPEVQTLLQHSRARLEQERQAETRRLERELATQRQLGLRTRAFLAIVSLIALLLAVNPVREFLWRQQALRQSELVPLGSFAMEKYEVSNARYELCVRAGACSEPIQSERYYDEGYAGYPVEGVNALQAADFCTWIGRHLPTDREWEAALKASDAPAIAAREILPVIPADVSATGVIHLHRNVSEWTRTYDTGPEATWDEEADTLSFDHFLVVRGGNWLLSDLESVADGHFPEQTYGIRCVSEN